MLSNSLEEINVKQTMNLDEDKKIFFNQQKIFSFTFFFNLFCGLISLK